MVFDSFLALITSSVSNELVLLDLFAYLMIINGCVLFVVLIGFNFQVGYGRYSGANYYIPFVPHTLISSKVGWVFQECPSFFIPFYYLLTTSFASDETHNKVLLLLFSIHYFHRSFVYPLFTKPKKQNPIFVHILGFFFCAWNGYLQGASLAVNKVDTNGVTFYTGMILFFIGAFVNMNSDYYLLSLRSVHQQEEKRDHSDGGKNKDGYVLPKGGMFELISCPNYFGETLEWTGYALSSGHIHQWAFAIFTLSNLAPRALQHHQFYKEKFANYPTARKAFIPFLC